MIKEYVRTLFEGKMNDAKFIDWVCEREGRFRFVVYQGMEAMDNNLEELNLTVRSYNCLRRAGYDTINCRGN